jgi:hypothetical protein
MPPCETLATNAVSAGLAVAARAVEATALEATALEVSAAAARLVATMGVGMGFTSELQFDESAKLEHGGSSETWD